MAHGKVIWWCFVPTEAEALEAAGLRESIGRRFL